MALISTVHLILSRPLKILCHLMVLCFKGFELSPQQSHLCCWGNWQSCRGCDQKVYIMWCFVHRDKHRYTTIVTLLNVYKKFSVWRIISNTISKFMKIFNKLFWIVFYWKALKSLLWSFSFFKLFWKVSLYKICYCKLVLSLFKTDF